MDLEKMVAHNRRKLTEFDFGHVKNVVAELLEEVLK